MGDTRQLYDRIVASETHGAFIRAVDAAPCRPVSIAPGTVIAIAPAALYREYRRSGADGGRVRAAATAAGLESVTIPLEAMGGLQTNAAILLRWLHEALYENIVLVSLSKGGADIKQALAIDSDAFARVSTWISIGGLLEGTPLARWLLSSERFPTAFRALNRLNGVRFRFLEDLDRRPGGPLDFPLRIPAHLHVIHLLGFCELEHCTNWLSRKFYRKIAPLGPSDGFMLLEDALHWPGVIYPLWGVDHYFRAERDPGPLLEQLLSLAAERETGGIVRPA